MTTDPISDMLTRLRNANAVMHRSTTMPASKMKEGIAKILVSEGKSFCPAEDKNTPKQAFYAYFGGYHIDFA